VRLRCSARAQVNFTKRSMGTVMMMTLTEGCQPVAITAYL
jgi:hypothetical protein